MELEQAVLGLALSSLTCAAALSQTPEFGEFVPVTEPAFADKVRPLDIDLDGDLDLLLIDSSENRLQWLEATGPGAFALAQPLVAFTPSGTAPVGPLDATLIDLAGNGVSDLVVSLSSDSRLVRLPRTGFRTFGPPIDLTQISPLTYEVAAVDVDGDGDEDLVAAGSFGSRGTWMFENVQGQLAAAPTRLGDGGSVIEPTDYDLDGDVDFFVLGPTSGLSVLRNDGPAQGFASTFLIGTVSTADLTIGDTNGDGFVDAVVSGPNGALRSFLGGASGTVTPGQALLLGPTFPGAFRIELVDLDGDLDLDIARAPLHDHEVEFIPNNGSGFGSPFGTALPATGPSYWFTRADLDGDGRDDLVAAGFDIVQLGLTAALGWPQNVVATSRSWRPTKDVAALDFDGDGDRDVVLVTRDFDVAVSLNDGSGQLDYPAVLPGFGPTGALRPIGITGADVDGDSLEDMLFETQLGFIALAQQQSGGGFTTPVVIGAQIEGPVRVADVDGDGRRDVLGTASGPDRIVAVPQLTPGMFGAPVDVAVLSGRVVAFDLADADNDGVLDLLTYEDPVGLRGRVYVRYGLATGSFEAPAEIPTPTSGTALQSLLFDDLDGDGRVDLVYAQDLSTTRSVRWTRNLGARTFDVPALVGEVGSTIFSIDVAERFPGGPKMLAVNSNVPGSSSRSRYTLFEVTPSITLGASQVLEIFGSFSSTMFFTELRGGLADLVVADGVFDRFGVSYNEIWRDVGASYCVPASVNSTGTPGHLSAAGSALVVDDHLELIATGLPVGSATYFLASLDVGFVVNPGGSSGNLCLGGAIGRLNQSGMVGFADASGTFRRAIDLTAIPQPTGTVPVLPMSTWRFQAWHRDVLPGQPPTSNFTSGVEVQFQ